MIASLPTRGFSAAALAAGLLLAGCSSDSDVPPTVASAPDGGTQMNTDTGSGGTFPDVNTVPNQRPTSTIQDLNAAPAGLAAAQSGTQYGEALVGGPTSSAAPPPPPPPPVQELPPNPEPGIQTQNTDSAPPSAEPAAAVPEPQPAPTSSSEPMATPEVAEPEPVEAAPETAEVVEPQPMEPEPEVAEPEPEAMEVTEPQPAEEPAPEVAEAPAAPAPQGQTIVADGGAQAPAEQYGEQYGAAPQQPAPQVALAPVQAPVVSAPQPQMPPAAYPPSYAQAPQAYGIAVPQPVAMPAPVYYPAQPVYPPAYYGAVPQMAAVPPAYGGLRQPGQPVALIYFNEGSSNLSSNDRQVLRQMAEMQRVYGGVLHVVGHASMGSGGNEAANQRISEERASIVAQQLMEYGVPQGAVQATAASDAQPLYSEAMPNGEAANRRAEVYLAAY